MALLYANNAASTLAAGISSGASSLTVASGHGSRFPSPTGGDWFPVTVVTSGGTLELMRCTARSGDVLTVTRGQEGTTAIAFTTGDKVELRLSAAALDQFVQDGPIATSSTETASTVVSPWQNVLSITPGANTQGIFFGAMGQAVYSGTTSITGGGHTVGTMGWSVNYGSGTHAMMIGAEGRLDQANIGQGAPTLTKGVGVLGLLNSSYGTITSAQGLASEISVGATATLTEAIGAKVSVTANGGAITKYTGLFMPEHTGFIAGITAKRFFECLDTQAPAVTKSPIVQQDYVVVSPASGATVTIGNFTTYTFVAPGGALAALTIALPSAPIDGQEVVVLITQDVAALTLTAGVAILNPLITISGGATFAYKYVQGSSVWALIQSPALLGAATPLADIAAGSVGTALRMSREDHRHPGPKITVSTTAPSSPAVGDLWVDTN
jgi:hypothetical protein